MSLSVRVRSLQLRYEMSSEVIDLISDGDQDQEEVIVIDDSPKTSCSEDSPVKQEEGPAAADEVPIMVVDMDVDEVIPISNQT